jgi:hypothetical protein
MPPVVASPCALLCTQAGLKSEQEPPSPSERMGRLLAAVHQAAGGGATAELLGAVRASLRVERDGEPDFGERVWAATQRTVAELWGAWGLEDGYEETDAKSAAEVGGAGGLRACSLAACSTNEGAQPLLSLSVLCWPLLLVPCATAALSTHPFACLPLLPAGA